MSLTIHEPGLYEDISDEDYHGDPIPEGSLSSTFARLLTEHVPAKAEARRRLRKPTKAMNFGKAVHSHALGAGPDLIVWEHDGRTKAGKEERAEAKPLIESEQVVAVTEAQRDQILGMVAALKAIPEVVEIFKACQSEVSGFWTEGGIWCRARYDLLSDEAPWDYKTTEDASGRGFERAMSRYGYHQQAELYQRGLAELAHPAANRRMRFICQETEAPYLVQIHTPDDEAMGVATDLNDRAIRIYAEATKTGVWPGFPTLHAEDTSLPVPYFYAHDHVLEHNPLADPELKL